MRHHQNDLGFLISRFGTRRSMVQIHSPRPLPSFFSCALSSPQLRYSSGKTGRTIMLTAEGSSRSFRYSNVPFGRGTVSVESTKPAGTGTVWLNCESEATESIRNRFVPVSLHCLSGLSGQRISFTDGTRTRFASGVQSPLAPSASTGRKRKGPKAEAPKLFAGSRNARTV